jgi:hypothetical protein
MFGISKGDADVIKAVTSDQICPIDVGFPRGHVDESTYYVRDLCRRGEPIGPKISQGKIVEHISDRTPSRAERHLKICSLRWREVALK